MINFKRLLNDAEQGVLPALKFLGDIYLNGFEENDIKPDLTKAIEYYSKAADAGMEDAMLDLGYIYVSGEYTEPDYATGIAYYERAAALGNTTALGNLGMAYCRGLGVEQDEKKGFAFFMKAAEGGHALAMAQVADMYRDGVGVEKDAEKEKYWRMKSEEQERLDQEAEEKSKQAKQPSPPEDFQDAFQKNLDFISKDHIEADFVKQIFENTDSLRQYIMGQCTFQTGKVITADPLCYLKDPRSVFRKAREIAPGSYPVQLAVMDSELAGLRIVGAKLQISQKTAVRYELAHCVVEKDGAFKQTFAGFPVECGMACFCDEQAVQSYWKFLEQWYRTHKDGNIYTDYFEELFAESYRNEPNYQREGGDLLMWSNPDDGSQIAMFASGLGDGYYTDYWGIDAEGEACELVIVFLNPAFFS